MKMMKSLISVVSSVSLMGMLGAATVYATPSTTYWTPAVSDIQPYNVWHIGIDNYFTLKKMSKDTVPALPTDLGLTVGVLPYEKLQMEVGVDFFSPLEEQLQFNAKIGTPENTLFDGSPALNLGIFGVGTKTSGSTRNDQNVIHVMAGKTLPMSLGRIHVGTYSGNDKALGKNEKTGFMIGYDKGFKSAKDSKGEFSKWVFAADYASGKNAIGGGGFGIYHYFTRDISLLTGPVWFNEKALNGEWKWTTQLDINF